MSATPAGTAQETETETAVLVPASQERSSTPATEPPSAEAVTLPPINTAPRASLPPVRPVAGDSTPASLAASTTTPAATPAGKGTEIALPLPRLASTVAVIASTVAVDPPVLVAANGARKDGTTPRPVSPSAAPDSPAPQAPDPGATPVLPASAGAAGLLPTAAQPSPPARPPAPPVADQVAAEVASRAQFVHEGNATRFYVRLEPPQLGTVHVHLRASEQTVSARLVVSNPEARQALEGQLPALQRRLGEAGVALGRCDVFQDPSGSGRGRTWQEPGAAATRPAPEGPRPGSSQPVAVLRPDRIDVVA